METTVEDLLSFVRTINPVPEDEVERLRVSFRNRDALTLLERTSSGEAESMKQERSPRRGWASVGRARYIAATVLLVAIGLIATPAFGFIRDLFQGAPAPPSVTQSLSTQNELAQAQNSLGFTHSPQVDPSSARGVLSVQTSDGPLYLWSARQVGGTGVCWFISYASDLAGTSRTAAGEGSCTQSPVPASKIQMSYGWGEGHLSMDRISGYVYADAVTVEVKLANDTTKILPVTEHLFLGVLPRGSKVTQLLAIDASGAIVASRAVAGVAP